MNEVIYLITSAINFIIASFKFIVKMLCGVASDYGEWLALNPWGWYVFLSLLSMFLFRRHFAKIFMFFVQLVIIFFILFVPFFLAYLTHHSAFLLLIIPAGIFWGLVMGAPLHRLFSKKGFWYEIDHKN